jgi:hypothetical protein
MNFETKRSVELVSIVIIVTVLFSLPVILMGIGI